VIFIIPELNFLLGATLACDVSFIILTNWVRIKIFSHGSTIIALTIYAAGADA